VIWCTVPFENFLQELRPFHHGIGKNGRAAPSLQ
jgi:hypothetical protein